MMTGSEILPNPTPYLLVPVSVMTDTEVPPNFTTTHLLVADAGQQLLVHYKMPGQFAVSSTSPGFYIPQLCSQT